MGLYEIKTVNLSHLSALCVVVGFFSWMYQTVSALSDTDTQTTDSTAPVKTLPSLTASFQPTFQGLTAP